MIIELIINTIIIKHQKAVNPCCVNDIIMPTTRNHKYYLITISLVSALMGVCQNGLLVSLPFLVEQSAFSLPTWSILIAIGSVLFLPSAPFWGRYSDQYGPKRVIVQALIGMAVSFSLLAYFSIISTHDISALICFSGLIIARIIYGLTVSGIVPACQHWAIILCGKNQHSQAITSVSIGLSLGRLLGPLIAIIALKISPFTPLIIMAGLPIAALLAVLLLPISQANSKDMNTSASLPWLPQKKLMPYLLNGLLLCASVALLQYSFSPLISSVTQWNIEIISDAIGGLLTLSAAFMLLIQFVVLKNKFQPLLMYRVGATGLVLGFLLFLIPNIWLFPVAMVIASSSAALLVPAYTSLATEQYTHALGSIAGYISMFHTIGYGIAALLAFSSSFDPFYPVYLCITFSFLILMTVYWVVGKHAIKPIEHT